MRYAVIAIGSAVLTVLVAVAVLFALDLEIVEDDSESPPQVPTIEVPNVVGQPQETARAMIEALGLEVREIGSTPKTAIGEIPVAEQSRVKEQIPPAGSQAPTDATVTVRLVPTG